MIYFFISRCKKDGLQVPVPAELLYSRMNNQLSKGFLRCAGPTCQHNKLQQSSDVQFKKCRRCKSVLYCSSECQKAHYPNHKVVCMKVDL